MENYERVLVIGDIHGHFKRFMSLYKKLNVTDNDLLIFLGDFIDRGAEGEVIQMIEWIMSQTQKENVIALRGNHEQMMIDFFDNGDINWLFNGGKETSVDIKVRMEATDKILLLKILDFAKNLPLYYRMTIKGQDYFFCHAGIDPHTPLDEQSADDLLWIREPFFNYYDGDTIIVVGHTPLLLLNDEGSDETWRRDYIEISKVKNIKPQWRRNHKILMMDTGSYFPNGCISCMDLLTGELWQSD